MSSPQDQEDVNQQDFIQDQPARKLGYGIQEMEKSTCQDGKEAHYDEITVCASMGERQILLVIQPIFEK